MTNEAQRIAIAKACGWKEFQQSSGTVIHLYGWKTDDEDEQAERVPDYLNDLNAMHEAEKVLSYEQQDRMARLIGRHDTWTLLHATAAQRAEAFLRTLNLWDDSR
jgi:hypothetical protein